MAQEEENFARISILMTGISPRAVRALFDNEFAPACLKSSLKKEFIKLQDLKNKRAINSSQWNLLFPRIPDKPDSKSFDVTLMITLLRNLTELTPPHGGYDTLPSDNETTPTSDLARIKYYRNVLAHLGDGKVNNTTFEAAWDNVTNAISRLGGQQMKQECDDLKIKILDQRLEKDPVPWNIRAQINQKLLGWKNNDKVFMTTTASKQVLKCIKKKSCVTIVASSGVGKTATLRHVALQMIHEGYDILTVTVPADIVNYCNPNRKTLFVIDDFCGNYSLNQIDIKAWEPFIEPIENILSNNLVKIIVACRLQVYQDEKFESLSVFKSCVCNFLSDNMRLSKVEKESIAKVYLKAKASDIMDYCDYHDCFPLLCKLYQDNSALDIKDFFKNPFKVYEKEIDQLQKKECYGKYCALALCVMFNDNLREEIFTEELNGETIEIIEKTCEACKLYKGTPRLTIQDELKSLIHTFLKEEHNIYKSIHDKMFDFLVFYFGQKIIKCLIKYAHSGLIRERFLLEKQINVDQFITVLSPQYHEMYIQRMIDDWSKGEINDVFGNINMKIPQFRQKFLCCLNDLDVTYQKHLALIYDERDNDTALLKLCFYGDIDMIHWCINHNADVNQCRIDETSPLHVASQEGWTDVVRILLDKRADYNKCNSDGGQPIIFASRYGHTQIVRMLLDKGAEYNTCDNNGVSSVMFACRYGFIEIVRMLLEKGAAYHKCDNNEWSPINSACRYGFTEIVRMLLELGADFNTCNNDGWSAINCACRYGHTEIVRMLLDIGANYSTCNNDGWSPILCASESGHTVIVGMLLDLGADYNKRNNNGWSPVLCSCYEGHTEIARMLLNKGADCNINTSSGLSPLDIACRKGHIEIVRMLLDLRVDYNKCNTDGWSPLMIACSEQGEEHTEIVRMLIDIGADYNKCNNDGWSPLMIALSEQGEEHTEILRMLIDIGADYNKYNNDGWSPLMIACNNGHTEIVRMLLDIGADYITCNNRGQSAIIMASERGHSDIVSLINAHSRKETGV